MKKLVKFCLIFLLASTIQWGIPFGVIDAAQSNFTNLWRFNELTRRMLKMLPNKNWKEGNVDEDQLTQFSAIFPLEKEFYIKYEKSGKFECVFRRRNDENEKWLKVMNDDNDIEKWWKAKNINNDIRKQVLEWWKFEGNLAKMLHKNGLISLNDTKENWLIDMLFEKELVNNLYQFNLFFSFLTRLSFTIGQSAFDEADFHIEHFARAYNCLRRISKDPVIFAIPSFEVIGNEQISMKFDQEIFPRFRRRVNFEAIQTLLGMNKLRVFECIEIIEMIVENQNGWGWAEVDSMPLSWERTEKGKLFTKILNTLTDDPTNAEAIYAIRNFGKNFAVRILNDFKHLEEGKQYLHEFNGIDTKLVLLIRKIENLEFFGWVIDEDLMVKKEIYMHFEDAIQIDFDANKEYLSIASKMANTCDNLQKLLKKCTEVPTIDGKIQCELRPSENNKFKNFNEFMEITEEKFIEKFQINFVKQEIEGKIEKLDELKNAIKNHRNEIKILNVRCAELTIPQMEEWKICVKNGKKIELNRKEIEDFKNQIEILGKEWQNLKQEILENLNEFFKRIKEIEEDLKRKII